jgi:hypothetical protein
LPRANLMSIKKIQRGSFLPSIFLTDSFLVSAGEAFNRGAKSSSGTSQSVWFIWFVLLIWLIWFIR